MHFKEDEKQKIDLTTVCSTCGKPIAGKLPRTDVTRYLFQESRCQCVSSDPVKTEELDPPVPSVALLDAKSSALDKQRNEIGKPAQSAKSLKDDWKATALANLPDYYEVISLIGEGGMGAVYKVSDKRLNKLFAVKILRPELLQDDNAVNRFEQEAKAEKVLTHVNLVSVYDYGVGKQGTPYLVMDYIPGKNLGDLIAEQGYIEVPRAMDLFLQIAAAIEHAHNKGILHRDIKPSNIIIEKMENGVEIAKLLDFGIAKVLACENAVTQGLTQTGEILGSPLYMSPEQAMGNRVDARSDIYAFGCVMYEALYGRPPFRAENPIRTIMKHIGQAPVPVSAEEVGQSIPDGLKYIVFHCLEKEPLDRYQSMHYLKNDLILESEHKNIYRYEKKFVSKDEELREVQRELAQKNLELNILKQQTGARYRVPEIHTGFAVLFFAFVMIAFLFSGFHVQKVSYKPIDASLKSSAIVTKHDSSYAAQLESRGKEYEALGDYEKALPYYEQAWAIYRKQPKEIGNLVVCTLRYTYVLRQLHRGAEADQIQARLSRN